MATTMRDDIKIRNKNIKLMKKGARMYSLIDEVRGTETLISAGNQGVVHFMTEKLSGKKIAIKGVRADEESKDNIYLKLL